MITSVDPYVQALAIEAITAGRKTVDLTAAEWRELARGWSDWYASFLGTHDPNVSDEQFEEKLIAHIADVEEIGVYGANRKLDIHKELMETSRILDEACPGMHMFDVSRSMFPVTAAEVRAKQAEFAKDGIRTRSVIVKGYVRSRRIGSLVETHGAENAARMILKARAVQLAARQSGSLVIDSRGSRGSRSAPRARAARRARRAASTTSPPTSSDGPPAPPHRARRRERGES